MSGVKRIHSMERFRKKGRFASRLQIKRSEILRQSQIIRWDGKQHDESVNFTSAHCFQTDNNQDDDFTEIPPDDILSEPKVVYSETVSSI